MNRVVEIKDKGNVVAVVGDGVNDAPALASGDISIAMGTAGSDVAIHSASIALMNEKLDRIPFIIHLSRRAIRVMRQNLIFSALYILILIIMSANGMIHPVTAVIMHTASAFIVVFNSARLLREGENLT
jgi:Cd2+/Zn2+-exporting ATPase